MMYVISSTFEVFEKIADDSNILIRGAVKNNEDTECFLYVI